eukprot:6352651-Karenia_brevis.AAC.1
MDEPAMTCLLLLWPSVWGRGCGEWWVDSPPTGADNGPCDADDQGARGGGIAWRCPRPASL